jgi:hypothetical protein
MAQQLNLYHPSMRPRREGWRAVHALWAVAGTLGTALALSSALQIWTVHQDRKAQAVEREVASQRASLEARRAGAGDDTRQRVAELERLRAVEAAQRRVRELLDAQGTRTVAAYTPYFVALSRQARGTLWITGLSVSADGQALELQGRMSDAAALPDYLRRLNAEPQFKGRSFAQLHLKAGDGYTEFVLRSQPDTEAAR